MTTDLKQQVREAVESLLDAAETLKKSAPYSNLYIPSAISQIYDVAAGLEDALAADTAKPIACVACEDKPRPPNDPCTVCGKSAEPEYEVRWTWGDGADTFLSEDDVRSYVETWHPDRAHTVRSGLIVPKPELSVEEAVMNVLCHRVGSVANGLGYIRDNDESREAIEALARALARERGA